MRVVIAGSGAVAIATAQHLLSRHHFVKIISSQDLGSPYPDEVFSTQSDFSFSWVRPDCIEDELKIADAVFCCGSLNMLLRLLSRVSTTEFPVIYFLTSWHDSVTALREQVSFVPSLIVPCYPAFACEIVESRLVMAGHYQLEVATDCLEDETVQDLATCLSLLGVSFKMLPMETRFRAHFSRTQFAYWCLSRSFVDSEALDPAARALVHSRWEIVASCCSDHPDLCLPLSSFLLGLKLCQDPQSPVSGIALIISALLSSKAYKLNYFVQRELN